MPTTSRLLTFAAAALVLLLIPGPAVWYIVARSVSQGRRAGLTSVLGTTTGALVHVLAAAFGLSALLRASAMAFGVVKVLGAGYLIYLGLRTLSARGPTARRDLTTRRPRRRLFVDGVLVSALNPKTALFFLAFLPQFVDRSRGPFAVQVLMFGFSFVALALCTDSAYALLAGTARHWLADRAQTSAWPRYVSGATYIGLGFGAAFTDWRTSR